MNHQSSFSLRSFFQPVDLTQGTCWKTLLVFAFPIIVSYLLQQVYSISDAAIVGQTLTASEVAGVNDTTSLAMIFLQFAFGASAGFCTVTPGVRFAGGDAGDQKRVTPPGRARELGSDYIVVGRPITQADDPVAAYRRCVAAFVG